MTKSLHVANNIQEATQVASRPSVREDAPGSRPAFQAGIRLVRRIRPDHSQAWRRLFQILFLALNACIGLQFVLFVRYFESGGRSLHVSRPPGVEGWLPIAGLMNLKYWLTTGQIPSMHPAGMFLILAFLLMSILFRKAFCSWLCPIGTASEALWKFGKGLLKHNGIFPRWMDLPLRSLKYILLALFVYAVGGMTTSSIKAFLLSPYGLVADVKMLDFFRDLSQAAAITLSGLIVLSVFFQNFWCRYLCPYGALMGIAAIFSPTMIRRDTERCVDCARCSRACPALLRVDKLAGIRSAECTGCLECVAACPAEGALQVSFLRRYKLPPWMMAAGLAALFFGIIAFARWNGTWSSDIPESVYWHLLPQLGKLAHP